MPFTISADPEAKTHTLQSYILSRPDFRKDRLPSLYASFTALEVLNIDGYRANITAWTLALAAACKKGLIPGSSDRLVLQTTPELVSALANSQWGTPAGLGKVVDEATRSGEWIPLQEFLNQQQSSRIWSILGWGYSKVVGRKAVNEEIVPVGSFVQVKTVDALARKALAEYSARPRKIDRIFTLELLRQDMHESLGTEISETDSLVLATHLARTLNCSFDRSLSMIKFPARSAKAEPISSEDSSVLLLKTSLQRLEALISQLTIRQTEQQQKARAYLARNPPNKTLALAALRSSKLAESALKTHTDQRNTLEELQQSLETAQGNLEMMQVMSQSEKVLSKLNKEIGGVERVDEVMEKVREGMRDTEEINAILADTGAVVDEQEIEDELLELEQQEKDRLERQMEAAAIEKLEGLGKVRTPQEDKDIESLNSSLGQLSVKENKTAEEKEEERAPLPA